MLDLNSVKKLSLGMSVLESFYIDPLAENVPFNGGVQAENEEAELKGGPRRYPPGERH